MPPLPSHGVVWLVGLNPVRGHSQPALEISTDTFNHGPAELVIVTPMPTREERNPPQVRVESAESGLHATSFVKCEDARSFSGFGRPLQP